MSNTPSRQKNLHPSSKESKNCCKTNASWFLPPWFLNGPKSMVWIGLMYFFTTYHIIFFNLCYTSVAFPFFTKFLYYTISPLISKIIVTNLMPFLSIFSILSYFFPKYKLTIQQPDYSYCYKNWVFSIPKKVTNGPKQGI